jgi:hypothetical protein
MTPHAASAVLFFLAGVGVTLAFAAEVEKEPGATVYVLGVISVMVFLAAIVLAVVR